MTLNKYGIATSDHRQYIGDWESPAIWAMKHRYIKSRPLRFVSKNPFFHRPWQIKPCNDMHPNIVIKKARQQGFTELMACIKMIHFSSWINSISVYTMPVESKAREIAKERILPLGLATSPTRCSPEIRQRFIKWPTTLLTKHIVPIVGGGHSTVIISGAGNEHLGESTNADCAFFDEFDRMPPNIVAAFSKSLSSSEFGFLRVFSTPTFPNQGVDGLYQQSDKKKWFYKCTKCNTRQYLARNNILQKKGPLSLISRLESHDIMTTFSDGSFIIGCYKCGKEINRMGLGEWVAEKPSVTEYSGYSTSQLDCAYITADSIMRDLKNMKPGLGAWYNYDLGDAYLGDSGGIVQGWIYSMVNPEIRYTNITDFKRDYPNSYIAIGIDYGKTNWYVVQAMSQELEFPIILKVGYFVDTPDPDDCIEFFHKLCLEWEADCCVADNGYGQDRNPKIYQSLCDHNIPFYGCSYPRIISSVQSSTDEPIFGPYPARLGEPHPHVKISRTASLKRLLSDIRRRRYQIANFSEEYLSLLDQHFRNIVIAVQEDAHGTPVETAVTLGPDHLLHAMNYSNIAMRWLSKFKSHLIELDGFDYDEPYVEDMDELNPLNSAFIEALTDTYDIL